MTVRLRNLARNFHRVDIGDSCFWFSYETCIAFYHKGYHTFSENVWSRTTGKHLNMISEKADRVPHDEFSRRLSAQAVFNLKG